jgi:hypothetical protein
MYKSALGENISSSEDDFLNKKLILRGLRYLKELNLIYKIENRLFAISYDLIYEAKYTMKEKPNENCHCAFAVKLKGKISISDAEFIDIGSECSSEMVEGYLERLNNKLIIDRVIALDLTDIHVTFDENTATWSFLSRSLIGSTTWTLIPPIVQLITPRKDECIRMIELCELIFDAVIN